MFVTVLEFWVPLLPRENGNQLGRHLISGPGRIARLGQRFPWDRRAVTFFSGSTGEGLVKGGQIVVLRRLVETFTPKEEITFGVLRTLYVQSKTECEWEVVARVCRWLRLPRLGYVDVTRMRHSVLC